MTVDFQAREALSDEQRERFAENGFLILDDPCPPELVDAVLADAESIYKDAFDPGPEVIREGMTFNRYEDALPRYHWHRVLNAWKMSTNIRSMALAPRVLATVEGLFGRRAMPYQTLNFPVGTQQREHIDAFIFNSDPEKLMCGVWVALEDMDMDNGPLFYYPGSHKIPMPRDWNEMEQKLGIHLERSDYPSDQEYMIARDQHFMGYCQDIVKQEGLERAHATVRKGQAVIWAPHLVHGGAKQNDLSRTRHSQVTHYFFEPARVYGPLNTLENGHRFYHYPEWIRDPPAEGTLDELRDAVRDNTPEGANVLMNDSQDPLFDIEGRNVTPFPQDENGEYVELAGKGEAHVAQLEQRREAGAEFVVFPRYVLQRLEFDFPELQGHLENNYRTVLRDGGYGAIYALS
jgi:ectoine hydroxylase-related dioxygenase (phytanoyl-CoA dioxygenase family)